MKKNNRCETCRGKGTINHTTKGIEGKPFSVRSGYRQCPDCCGSGLAK